MEKVTTQKSSKPSKKLDNGDAINLNTHTSPEEIKFRFCPLYQGDCRKKDCEWFMEADDECAIYRIARCIL